MKSKEQKRIEAEVRQEAYGKLTPAQRINKLNKGINNGGLPYRAKKEREKLAKLANHK